MAASIEIKSTVKVFAGSLIRFSHMSAETKTAMTCAVYLPQETSVKKKFPTLMYLSGLTCTVRTHGYMNELITNLIVSFT